MGALLRVLRVVALVVCAVAGTALMVLAAPGYFSDAREMDAAHAQSARAELQQLQEQQGSPAHLLKSQFAGWFRGDLGISRQYGSPVAALLKERSRVSLQLLACSVALGWSSALLLAIPLSMNRNSAAGVVTAAVTALLLAVPVSLLATLCLVSNMGGPIFTLALMVAVRDFKLLHRAAQATWSAPHILHARASGIAVLPIVLVHLRVTLRRELAAMAVISFTLALSALVPVEVVFDTAGVGQLAWSAAMNRDLPVLAAVTALMAAAVGISGALADQRQGASACA